MGYPDIEATVEAALLLAGSGCDIIELGIADPQQAAAALADGVIIGSRIIQIMEKDEPPYKELGEFIRQVRKSIDGVGV